MAGKSKKEMHPFFKKLCAERGWDNLSDMAKDTGISLSLLRVYAYDNQVPAAWVSAIRMAEAFGMPVESVMEEIMAPAKVS